MQSRATVMGKKRGTMGIYSFRNLGMREKGGMLNARSIQSCRSDYILERERERERERETNKSAETVRKVARD